MTEAIQKFEINNLEDMGSIFNRVVAGEDIQIENLNLNFIQSLDFKFYGDEEKYNGSLPASLAQGLCEFQTEMYKVYTLIKYKTDNLQKLTTEDREVAELMFSINSGCTEIFTSLSDLIKSFGDAFGKVTQGMSPRQKTMCFLFALTVLGGGWLGTAYLDHRTEVEVKQEEVKLQEVQQRAESERLTIMRDGMLSAIKANAGVDAIDRAEGIQEHTAKAYAGVLKGAADADKVIIRGANTVELSQEDVQEIIKNPVERAKSEQRTLEVSIDGIKRSAEKLTLSCHEPTGENTFPIYVDTSFINDKDELALLFDAMKENRTVKILGSYKIRAGVIEQGNASTITAP